MLTARRAQIVTSTRVALTTSVESVVKTIQRVKVANAVGIMMEMPTLLGPVLSLILVLYF